MNRSLLSPMWTNDPAFTTKEVLTITDVIGTAGYSVPGNSPSSVVLTLGNAASGEIYSTNAMLYGLPGLLSIPVGPGSYDNSGNFDASNTSVTACQAVSYFKDDQCIVLATRDTRTQTLAGQLNAGETCLYSQIGQGRVILKADGSINLYTAANANATAMCLSMDPNSDSISLVNSKGYGIIINENGVTITTGSANPGGSAVQLNSSDGSINITATGPLAMDGTAINLGYQVGAELPLNAALVGPTGIAGVASTKVLIALT